MSFLTPLYALGLLAVAAPVVFHLIRRTPRGEVPFGSLMFLSPTPPRLTRRSRIDHWLLLLLRASALALLALAFARPFLREAARLDAGGGERRRVAVLVDTSASMRRGDLWARAQGLADAAVAAARPGDEVAVFAFDAATRPLLTFAESATLDPARRQAVARAAVARLTPTWGQTDLGQALVDAAGAIEDAGDARVKAGRIPRRVVLVTDLQQGARLDALAGFEWPSDVEVELKTVADAGPNAVLQRLADPAEGDPKADGAAGPRVRVSNDPGSRREAFELRWVDAKGAATGAPVSVYVPPGESRVVRAPEPPAGAPRRALRLTGDAHPFDNTVYFADEPKSEATVLYFGPDTPDDPAGLLYYLQRVFEDTPRRSVRVEARSSKADATWEAGRAVPLAVVAAETRPATAARLREYARGGGTVLFVATAAGKSPTLAALAGVDAVELTEAAVARDVMLGEVAFDHPLFAPLAGAQFNDFTKVHFWKYRHLDPAALGAGSRALARFENGDAAVVEVAAGAGRVVVLASGWGPADSQLARSSKFVPLMAALLDGGGPPPADAADHHVNDRVPLPAAGSRPVVHKPDGTTVALAPGGGAFAGADVPGVYTVDAPGGPRSFAVNLDPAEGKTAPLSVETLEQLGCKLVSRAPAADDAERLRQMRGAELEGRQKLWRPLVVAVLGILLVETWLAGRLDRPRPARAEARTT